MTEGRARWYIPQLTAFIPNSAATVPEPMREQRPLKTGDLAEDLELSGKGT